MNKEMTHEEFQTKMDGLKEAPDNVQNIGSAKKVDKIAQKRARDLEERRRRLVNQGVPEDKLESVMAIEDYNNLSLDRKFARFEKITASALQGLQQDIMALRHNDGVIADAIDVNMRAMARALDKAGVSLEAQGVIIKEVEQELRDEAAKKQQAAVDAQKAAVEADEHARMSAVLKSPSITDATAGAVSDSTVTEPAEATVFGDS